MYYILLWHCLSSGLSLTFPSKKSWQICDIQNSLFNWENPTREIAENWCSQLTGSTEFTRWPALPPLAHQSLQLCCCWQWYSWLDRVWYSSCLSEGEERTAGSGMLSQAEIQQCRCSTSMTRRSSPDPFCPFCFIEYTHYTPRKFSFLSKWDNCSIHAKSQTINEICSDNLDSRILKVVPNSIVAKSVLSLSIIQKL